MTDKAEMPDDLWIRGHDRKYTTHLFLAVVRPSVGDTRYIRADLYDAQAAQIERLRVFIDELELDPRLWT